METQMKGYLLMATIAAAMLPSVARAGEVRFAGDGHAQNPVWSKDGKWLAFEVNRYGENTTDLFYSQVQGEIAKDGVKVNLPGGSSKFGAQGSVVENPVWHPQAIMIFEGSNQGGQYRVYIASPTGGAASEMLSTTQAPGNLTLPSIAPNGNDLAYVSSSTGNGDVYTWNRSSNKIAQVTRDDGSEMFPQYSSDGAKLLFTRKANNTEDVFVMDAGQEKPVVGGGGDQTRPVYAANGVVVYYTNERGQDTWDIAMVDASGAKKTLATDVSLSVHSRPAVSSDGQWVAYTYAKPPKDNVVVLTRLDGSKTVTIPTSFNAVREPALGLQNGRMLLAYTYLPDSSASWRKLFVVDVTDKAQ